jgi:hypothetical protein
MLRPHVTAIALMLVSCPLFHATRTRRDLWRPLLMGAVFAWAYSNPHFVLLPACAFAAVKYRRAPKLAVALPLAAGAGIMLGYTLHPQFPNTFLNWKIQCVDVVLQSLSGRVPVRLGTELAPPNGRWFLQNAGVPLLFVTETLLLLRISKTAGTKRIGDPALAVYLVAAVANIGVLLAKRMMEYACPFTVLSAGLMLREWRQLDPVFNTGRAALIRRARPVAGLALAVGIGVAGCLHLRGTVKGNSRPLTQFADWTQKAQLPVGTLIANPVWSDFPLLFYTAPQYRYLVGLDPMFGYAYAPERMARLEQFRTGRLRLAPSELHELTGAQLAFVSEQAWQLARAMASQGYALIYQGPDGCVFNLQLLASPPPSAHE